VRNNDVVSPEAAGPLRAGDYGYFLVSPARIPRLDRLFAPRDVDAIDKSAGIFLFKGDVRLADVAGQYGLSVSEDLRTLTIADAFAERFEKRLEPGDTVQLGPAALVAVETDGDLLITAALEIDDEGDEPEGKVRSLKQVSWTRGFSKQLKADSRPSLDGDAA